MDARSLSSPTIDHRPFDMKYLHIMLPLALMGTTFMEQGSIPGIHPNGHGDRGSAASRQCRLCQS